MAVDIFIKIGDIKGESMDKAHKDEIDVLNWSWGMSQSGNMHVGGGGGAGKVNIQDLSLTKYVDKASPNLMMHCASGKHIDKVTLTVRKAGGELLTTANLFLESAAPASSTPPPAQGQTTFYFLTFDGIRAYTAPEEELGYQRDRLSPVFHAAHSVITELRLRAP